jgi:hypothetical protein
MEKKLTALIVLLFVILGACKEDEEYFDNLNSLPESDGVFYLLNNDFTMIWSTDGETWSNIYKQFNATQNTPNSARFATNSLRIYAYADGTLYDAEKGAYYNIFNLDIPANDECELAVTQFASHILNKESGQITIVPHNIITFSTFELSSTPGNVNDVIAFLANSQVVFAYAANGQASILVYSDDDGATWKSTEPNIPGQEPVEFSEVTAWGEDFYALGENTVYTSNNAVDWVELSFDYDESTVGGDTTAVDIAISDLFAEKEYINFNLLETITTNSGQINRELLLESFDGGSTWASKVIDIPDQTEKRIYRIGEKYVTEIMSSEKSDKSLHFSSDLQNWTVVEGEQIYMEYLFQLFKAQTVR